MLPRPGTYSVSVTFLILKIKYPTLTALEERLILAHGGFSLPVRCPRAGSMARGLAGETVHTGQTGRSTAAVQSLPFSLSLLPRQAMSLPGGATPARGGLPHPELC